MTLGVSIANSPVTMTFQTRALLSLTARFVFICAALDASAEAPGPKPFPKLSKVGAANSYRYRLHGMNLPVSSYNPQMTLSNLFPVSDSSLTPSSLARGTLQNYNAKSALFANPVRFVIGDGSIKRVFIGVDKSPGSTLNAKLDRVMSDMMTQFGVSQPESLERESVYRFLADELQSYIAWAKGAPERELDWDRALAANASIASSTQEIFRGLIDNFELEKVIPLPNYVHPIVPLEKYIERQEGYCQQMVMLASLVLERLKIPHNPVSGAVVDFGNSLVTNGHSWIEIPDGRILDVAWQTLDLPEKNRDPEHPDWLWFGNARGHQYRFKYAFYPILSLDP